MTVLSLALTFRNRILSEDRIRFVKLLKLTTIKMVNGPIRFEKKCPCLYKNPSFPIPLYKNVFNDLTQLLFWH